MLLGSLGLQYGAAPRYARHQLSARGLIPLPHHTILRNLPSTKLLPQSVADASNHEGSSSGISDWRLVKVPDRRMHRVLSSFTMHLANLRGLPMHQIVASMVHDATVHIEIARG